MNTVFYKYQRNHINSYGYYYSLWLLTNFIHSTIKTWFFFKYYLQSFLIDTKLPTHTPTFEPQAQPAGDQSKSKSRDPVQEEASMDWENGALPPEDQHREGQADAKDAYDQGKLHLSSLVVLFRV